MSQVLRLLKESPVLLLFVVAGLGWLVGRARLFGLSLGVAAVLFVGLAVGALDPDLKLPEFVQTFGLVLFVYTLGLSSGPGFFASFRRRGGSANLLALGAVVVGSASIVGAHLALHASPGSSAGLFSGSLTNTPALAGALQRLSETVAPASRERALAEPVVAYSLSYPFGVLGVLAAIKVMSRIFRVDYERERTSLTEGAGKSLTNLTVRVTREEVTGRPLEALRRDRGFRVLFGRVQRKGESVAIATDDTTLSRGDLVTIVGAESAVREVAAAIGEPSDVHLDFDRRVVDYRRMFVSNPKVVGQSLASLQLTERFGAVITRLRRGDVELLPDKDTVLELGDRVRVVAPRARMEEISRWFGDSYKALSEMDIITFSLGIALGLILGSIPIPLPTGAPFKLGFAGGPLIVGLLLGRLGRSGPLTWSLPFSVGMTVRQLGLVLFLAGIGTRSGWAFVSTLRGGGGLGLLVAGALVTTVVAVATLWVGHRLLKLPMGMLVGTVAGIHTQPAALAFACEQTKNELPNLGYAVVFPVATISKILAAQLLVSLLR